VKFGVKHTFLKVGLGLTCGLLVLFFNNCRGKSESALVLDGTTSSSKSADNASGIGATGTLCEQDIKNLYDRGWHQFLQTNCAICHTNGPGKGRFANKDLDIAYTEFMQVGYVKVGNNAVSSTHNPPYSGVQHTQTVNELKLEWQKGLQDYATCTGDKSVIPAENLTEKISLKTTDLQLGLEKDGDKKVLTWTLNSDLTRVKGTDALPNIPGGKISITVTRLKNASGFTYYTFSSPTLYGASVDTRIQSIFINMNDYLLNYPTTFSRIDKSIRNGSANDLTGLISTGSLVAPKVVLPSDRISLSFIDITAVTLPPPPPPIVVTLAESLVRVVPTGTASMDVTISLSNPAQEPVVVTLSENTDLCGVAATYVNSNTLFKDLDSSCLPDVFNAVCPNGTCADPADKTFGRARSVIGTTWNRYDWDYKFPVNTVTFNVGETSKVLKVLLSTDVRHEKNRLLTLDISAVLGSVNIGANKTQHFVIQKSQNPLPSEDVLAFTELMNPNSGILGQNCVKCHNSSINAGGYDMTDYQMMIDKKVLVPGDVSSKMYVRMHPTPEFLAKPMPQDGFLTQDLILEVQKWLLDGAKNN